jgi:hypothetical protein
MIKQSAYYSLYFLNESKKQVKVVVVSVAVASALAMHLPHIPLLVVHLWGIDEEVGLGWI